MSDKPIMAKAFGGDYPVCSEKDKLAIEEGYKKAFAWLETDEGKKADEAYSQDCSCTLIARLLNGTATYADMVFLGIDMARNIYRRKMAGEMILGLMQSAQGMAESLEPPPFPGGKPKKEWIN